MSSRYHLCKQTRVYEGEPYHGHTSESLGLVGPAEFDNLEEAIFWSLKFQQYNPVGWNVFDSQTGQCLVGKDLFK